MFQRYELKVYINGIWFHDVLIDSHVTERHGDSIDDQLVFRLVGLLHMKFYKSDDTDENGFEYFVNSELYLDGKPYRMVWLVPPDRSYIGVRTAFRRRSHGK